MICPVSWLRHVSLWWMVQVLEQEKEQEEEEEHEEFVEGDEDDDSEEGESEVGLFLTAHPRLLTRFVISLHRADN